MKDAIKSAFRAADLSVRQLRQDGRHTLLGLRGRRLDAIVDVGANEGQFAAAMLEIFPNAVFTCVEPLPGPFAVLSRWAEQHGGRVVPVNCALGAEEGMVTMHLHVDHTVSSSLLPVTATSEALYPAQRSRVDVQVPMRRLDDLRLWADWADGAGERLLKLDVQGLEEQVLSGSAETLRHVQHVMLEASLLPLYEGQATFAGLVSLLAGEGFTYRGNIDQAVRDSGSVIYVDALFSRVPID